MSVDEILDLTARFFLIVVAGIYANSVSTVFIEYEPYINTTAVSIHQ